MAINIRTYSREDGSSHAGIWKGLPPRDLVGQTAPRPNRSRSDVSIQVDVAGASRTIGNGRGDSDRGTMGRRKDKELKNKGNTTLYSHEDIREQYCINSKELEALERARKGRGFFGCLSSHKEKPCKKKRSFFALCVRRASDENLYNGCNKPVQNTSRSVTLPALKPYTVPLKDADGGSDQPTFRTRPQSFCTTDPRRYSIQAANQFGMTSSHGSDAHMMQSQDSSWKSNTLPLHRTYSEVQEPGMDQMNASRPFRYGGRLAYTQPNTPELSAALHRRQMMSSEASCISALGDEQRRMAGSSKHVSFDASSPTSEIYTSAVPANSKSQERLLDSGRKTPEFLQYPPQVTVPVNHRPPESKRSQGDSSTFSPVLARAILLERLRQASMRTQATQTEGYYNSCVVSTTSLSPYPASYLSSESISTHTRQVQTNFEPREHSGIPRRLTKSYSNVDSCNATVDGYMKAESDPEFHPQGVRLMNRNDMSQSQPDELDTADYSPPSPGGPRRNVSSSGGDSGQIRRRQLLKALSEGTILLDRRKALSFATGYVEVDVHQSLSPQEELAVGRVVVHDSHRHQLGSGAYDDDGDDDDDDDDDDDAAFVYPPSDGPLVDLQRRDMNLSTAASSSDTTRSLLCSDVDVADVDWPSDPEPMPPPPLADGPAEPADCSATPPPPSRHKLTLPSQKSFDSISTGDELASANSLATVVARVEDPDSAELSVAPRRSAPLNEEEDSEREIMVQFPPWPSDVEVIPAPPNFATCSDVGPSPPPMEPSQRTPALRDMQNRFKSLSETITSVDSDSTSERHRVTEHETSASSEPLSPASEIHSPEGGLPADSVGDESSDGAFLTAMSGGAAPLAGGLTVSGANGSLSRSFRDFSEESSRNSTLRMTDISIYEDATCRTATNDDVVEPELVTASGGCFAEDPLPSPPERRGAASSTNESNNDGRESSTSGSYSLDAAQSHDEAPASDLPPPPPPDGAQSPTAGSATLTAAARRLSYRTSSKSEESRRYSRYLDESGAPADPDADVASFEPPEEFCSTSGGAWPPPPSSPSPPPPPPPPEEESPPPPESAPPTDRRKLIEGMKLQFPPGATMFSAADGSLQTPAAEECQSRPLTTKSAGRRRNASGMHRTGRDSSPSDEEEESNNHRKRHGAGSCARTRGTRGTPSKTPSVEAKPFVVADLVLKKRERDAASASGGAGMVRSPAMHEGFRTEDWVLERSTPTAECSDPTVLVHQASVSESTSHPLDQEPDKLAPEKIQRKKNLSCESLRSISPGSDNVFVTEPSGGIPSSAGGEVVGPPEGFQDSPVNLRASWPSEERESTPGNEASADCGGKRKHRDSSRGQRTKSCSLPAAEPAQPNLSGSTKSLEAPADWEDSPSGGRKIMSGTELGPNRAVSAGDMCWFPETQLPPKRQLTVRAKSEERERGSRAGRRHLARSVDASWESLGSSRTSCDGTPLEDEDAGIYSVSYQSSSWTYIGETDELQVWRRSQPPTPGLAAPDGEDSSTASEKDFRRKYTAITHRMVHRKSSVEMFRRLATSTFECDDVVVVKRESGEFGFRIHGSRPVVVSAIEPGTPAEESGLQVGDILIAINDVSVLDASHSEVVRIAHAGSDELKLEVARTCHVLAMGTDTTLDEDDPAKMPMATDSPVVAGYLWKRSQSNSAASSANVCWYRRWFTLRRDNCLYYYKNQESSQPLGAVSLLHYAVTRSSFPDRSHGLLLSKGGSVRHWLAAESEDMAEVWQNAMNEASRSATHHDAWLDVCTQNILLAPASIAAPDCLGHLMKLGHRAKEWQRRFCLLKDACLYFYVDLSATSALGAIHLHGYRVQSTGTASSGERRKFAFELLPPEPRMRHFHFYTDSENDRKRWIAALEYSIDRWIRVG